MPGIVVVLASIFQAVGAGGGFIAILTCLFFKRIVVQRRQKHG